MILRLIFTFNADWEKAPNVGSKPLVSVIKIMKKVPLPDVVCVYHKIKPSMRCGSSLQKGLLSPNETSTNLKCYDLSLTFCYIVN